MQYSHDVRVAPHIEVDEEQQILVINNHRHILPAKTWHIFNYLFHHPNRVISWDELLTVGWPNEPKHPTIDLYRHIHRIRQVIEFDPRHPNILITRREIGYQFNRPLS